MGRYPNVICKHCGDAFETQVRIDPAIYGMGLNPQLGGTRMTCPHCNAIESYWERDLRYTHDQAVELARFGKIVTAYVDYILAQDSPLEAATGLLHDLHDAKKINSPESVGESKWAEALGKWLPNTPEKLAAWIAIGTCCYNLLTKSPDKEVEPAQIINDIDETVIIQMLGERPENSAFPHQGSQIRRNEPCPCGSGKRYKHCHGQVI